MMRLAEAQQAAGWDSSAYFPLTQSLTTQPLKLSVHTVAAVLDDRVIKNPEFGAPISVLRDKLSTSLDSIPRNSDLIHLHWINGVTTLEKVRKRFPQARLVWTLHDMNPFTGACHQSLGCGNFSNACKSCPAVREPWKKLVTDSYQKKMETVFASGISVVAPSEWLRGKAKGSAVFEGKTIDVIPNPLSKEFLTPPQGVAQHSKLKIVVAVVAGDLSDPLKRVRDVVDAYRAARAVGSNIQLKLIGKHGGNLSETDGVTWLGPLSKEELRIAVSKVDYLVQASGGESFGLTVTEAASQGVFPIVRAGGSLAEIQKTLGHGLTFNSTSELVNVFRKISSSPPPPQKTRDELRGHSLRNFSPEKIESSYSEIYSRLGIFS